MLDALENKDLLGDTKLCYGAKLLYAVLDELSDDSGCTEVSNEILEELFSCSRGTLCVWLRSLIGCGWVHREIINTHNGKKRVLHLKDYKNKHKR
jgi:DNA-binding HxlR family transcriptional regulator